MPAPFTLLEYHQRITEFLNAMMVSDPSQVATIEALGGKPFDIQNIMIPDLGYNMIMDGISNVSTIEEVWLSIGDWKYTFFMDEAPIWYLRHNPNSAEISVSVSHKGQWAGRGEFGFDNSLNPMNLDSEELAGFIYRIIDAPKRRIGITIREAEKYLANQAYYDTLKAALKIKPRKKK